MKNIYRKITSMIRRAKVSLPLDDDGNYPTTQVSYLGKTADIEVIWPYGMNGRLPTGAQVLCFNVEGMEENKAGIGNVPTLRFKVAGEGEVAFGNPLTGSVVYFRENGDIEIVNKNDESVVIDGNSNIVIAGNSTETITGTKNVVSSVAVNITAPTVTLTGNAIITGNLSVGGKDFLTHDHSILGGSSAPGPTGGVN